MRITFLGTGTIGAPMARNAAAAGLEVTAWNRTEAKARALEADGITVATDPVAAVDGADIVVTVLSDGPTVEELVTSDGMLDAMRDKLWAQMSTVGVPHCEALAQLAAENEIGFIDSPVLGTKAPAEAGQLIVLAAGPPEAKERVGLLFDAIGKETRWLAAEPGAASRLKVVINTWIVGLVETLGESIALAEALDIDPADFLAAIEGGPLNSGYAQMKGKAMIERDFTPSFSLRLAAKDAGLAVEAAQGAGIELPLAEAVRAQMSRGSDAGHADEDMAATFLTARGDT